MTTTTSSRHGPEHSEQLCLYALEALPPSEVSPMEAHLSNCSRCQQELATLRPVVESLVSWPTDVLRARSSLWDRLAQRIAMEGGAKPTSRAPQRWTESQWEDVAPGIACKVLAMDEERHRVSMLVRLAPGAAYPAHRHADLEELHLLYGELLIDEKTLRPGDYNRAERGTVDRRVWSATGCTCVLVTSVRDDLL